MKIEPYKISERIRTGRFIQRKAEDRARFGPTGAWRAGSQTLQSAIQCWWAAEENVGTELLKLAHNWLCAPESEGKPWGEPPIFHEALHRQAMAIAAWACGEFRPEAWQQAAAAMRQWLSEHETSEAEPWMFEAALCDWLSGSKPSETALSDIDGILINALRSGDNDASAFAAYLYRRKDDHFDATDIFGQAILQIAAFGKAAQIKHPPLCMQAIFALLPEVPIPSGLKERGWNDAHNLSLELVRPNIEQLTSLLAVSGMFCRFDTDRLKITRDKIQPAGAIKTEVTRAFEKSSLVKLEIDCPTAGRLGGLISDIFAT